MPSAGGALDCHRVPGSPSSIPAPGERLNDVTVHFERSVTSPIPPSGGGFPADPGSTRQPLTASSGTLHQFGPVPFCVIRKYLPVAELANGTAMMGCAGVGAAGVPMATKSPAAGTGALDIDTS